MRFCKFSSVMRPSKLMLAVVAVSAGLAGGCASSGREEEKSDDFFTSGSPEADRRASAAVSDEDKTDAGKKDSSQKEAAAPEGEEPERTLYERLGGEAVIREIVDDFLKRALADPRVNWAREGVVKNRWFRGDVPVEWEASTANVTRVKEHIVQFLSLASGGPIRYDGKPIQTSHADLQITKPEFDAAVGDFKATLDSLGIESELQKELLSIIESTRPQIVADR